ncbi:Receptor-like protein 6 [Camellia lanceoleosa]|uniref:Receptor-like protein 6 n=1 Tax=Camellia lanceoleosa TaxID=1840588 RepID=A0ACC0G7H0_9ERIC|nr:Receptor-like protein 6 [Camellia lanceoleosa]
MDRGIIGFVGSRESGQVGGWARQSGGGRGWEGEMESQGGAKGVLEPVGSGRGYGRRRRLAGGGWERGCRRVLVSGQCLNDQSSLLLQLKNNLRYNSTVSVKLVNWTQTTDCCRWKGVTCDKEGHVTGLDLNSESISGGINHLSSLFSLQFLQNLNLAYNNFNFTQVPPSFGNLTRLTHLNLSNANLAGQIPIVLSHMTKLVTLDLSTLYFPGAPSLKLENPNLLKLVQNLTGLKTLLLDGVNISAQASQWCEAISSSLPNLRVLSLSNCNLSGPIDSSLLKLQFLSDIRLGQNNLSARVPEFFSDLPNLRSLHLCSSNLHGKFPEKIFQVSTLKALDLSYNRLLQGFLPQFPPNGSLHTLNKLLRGFSIWKKNEEEEIVDDKHT